MSISPNRPKLVGGNPITAEIAIELRQIVFGNAATPPRGEWMRTGFMFDKDISFGLRCPRNATRGLQSVVQAYIIKNLIFDNRPKDKSVPIEQLLKPRETEQTTALWSALSEILWNIGEKTKVIVAIPGDIPHIPHSQTYFQDTVTEKLYLFEFMKLDDLQIFVKLHIAHFMENPGTGALLLLYAAILTRTGEQIRSDLDAPKGAHLMGPFEEGALNIVTLMSTGRATPYLHNGVIYVGDEDHYALPQFGILSRAAVGLLVWDGENDALKTISMQPASRLKTPATPIWVTCCCGHYGVIFNSNRELLRNYHAEKRFELHHYTCGGCYISMTVDNRGQDDNNGHNRMMRESNTGSGSNNSNRNLDKRDEMIATPLEKLIHTKWESAKVTFHGPAPPSINF